MNGATPQLIFVYNAPDGLAAALIDAAHKIISPATYPCSLCAVTYGAVAMKGEWKAWLKTRAVPPVFYHRDGFHRAFPALAGMMLPVILTRHADEQPGVLLDAATLDALPDVPALIAAIEARLAG